MSTHKKNIFKAFICILAFVMALGFGTTANVKTVGAYSDTYGSVANSTSASTYLTTDLWDETNNEFNAQIVSTFMGLINPMIKNRNLNSNPVTAENIRTNMLSRSYASVGDSSVGADIVVTLGGLEWMITYISQSKTGDIIATLWLSGVSTLTTSVFNSNISHNSSNLYPSNMYSASQVRGVLNGTYYVKNGGSKSQETQNATLSNIETVIGDYIVEPQYVAWQEFGQKTHETVANGGIGWTYDAPNENWGDISTQSSITNNDVFYEGGYKFKTTSSGNSSYSLNYSTKTYEANDVCAYDAWKNDKFWLPSITETGAGSSRSGLWQLTQAQRSATASVSWLRSGAYGRTDFAFYLNSSGDYSGDYVLYSYAVRPALHLNLTAMQNLLKVKDTQSGIKYTCAEGEATVTGYQGLPDGSNVVIPSSITVESESYDVVEIDDGAFDGCSALQSITIPATVTNIGASAFANCSNLTSVVMSAETPPELGEDVFDNANANLSIMIPTGTMSVYSVAESWSAYQSNLSELPETGIVLDIILPSTLIGLIALAVVMVWKKKEQF